jgi:hypothetical protein
MRNIIVATALALTSVFAYAPSSFADSVTVTTKHTDNRNWHGHHHRNCYTKTVKSYHHGRVVVTKKRVCR